MVDNSLYSRVKEVIEASTQPVVTEDSVVEELCRRHREYQRKKKVRWPPWRRAGPHGPDGSAQSALRISVSKVMQQLKGVAGATVSTVRKVKRRRPDDGGATPASPAPPSETPPADRRSGGMLNQTVTQAYAATGASSSGGDVKRRRKRRLGTAAGAPSADATEADGAPPQHMLGPGYKGARVPGGPEAKESRSWVVPRPATRYADLAGMDATLEAVKELVEYPLTHPEIFSHLGAWSLRARRLSGRPVPPCAQGWSLRAGCCCTGRRAAGRRCWPTRSRGSWE